MIEIEYKIPIGCLTFISYQKYFLQWNRLMTFLFSCDNIFRVIFGMVIYRLLSSKMNMFDNYLWFWHQPKVKEAYFGTYMVLNTPLRCFGSSKVVETQKIKSVYRAKYFNFIWFPGVEILRNLPETMRMLCLSTKFPHQEIRWN